MPSMHDRASRWYDHFLTGALVPLGIATEPLLRSWFEQEHKFEPGVSQGLSLAAFYAAAIFLLWAFGELLESSRSESARLWLGSPISLSEKVGDVDGDWIDAIYQDGKLIQGSTISIASTNEKGFTISGYSYDFDSEGEKLGDKEHNFDSTETVLLANRAGIGYVFRGIEVGDTKKFDHHDGAGFYEFKISAKGDRRFTGAFFAESRKYIRTVDGLRIEKGKTPEEKKALLLAYLVSLK